MIFFGFEVKRGKFFISLLQVNEFFWRKKNAENQFI